MWEEDPSGFDDWGAAMEWFPDNSLRSIVTDSATPTRSRAGNCLHTHERNLKYYSRETRPDTLVFSGPAFVVVVVSESTRTFKFRNELPVPTKYHDTTTTQASSSSSSSY